MRFEILGPLRVATGDVKEPVPVAGVRLRVLLAALLWRANKPVPVDELTEIVWDGAPPAGESAAMRTLILRLRRLLGDQAGGRVITCNSGYLIGLDDDELDALRFEALCRQAGASARDSAWGEVAGHAAWALALWRGAPLVDVPCQALRDAWVPHLEQVHLQALEWRIEADLHLGRHDQVVSELRDLSAAHPFRERFHAQLMLALARGGRQAEALEVYQGVRRVLIGQLGIEPGPELQGLQERVLVGDAELVVAAPSPRGSRSADTPAVPRQLPAAARNFVGRECELDALSDLIHRKPAADEALVISAIDGMAGIGKTALAVHAARRLARRFPDGQLFIDLHGYTKGDAPRGAGEALEAFLRALGVPAQQIPQETDQRGALFRQLLADTRTLIVLDNAVDEAQVRPLLPGEPGCLVLVTSRRRLKGLDDARSLSLDLLPHADAVALLRAVAGADPIPAHDPLLAEIAELCGRLPLALRIAGALLRHRPAWSPEHLAGLLRDRHHRVQALSDGERDLATVFDLSYTALDEPHRRLFRRLGLVPGPDADAYAAAALLDVDPDCATRLLEGLVDHNLLIEHAPGRYRMHDLLRARTRTLADTESDSVRAAALDRLLHFYTRTAQTASLRIARFPRPASDGPDPAHSPALTDAGAARAWLRAERDNLEAASAYTRTCGLDEHAVALAAGLAEIMLADGPFARALDLHRNAAETARRRGSPAAHAAALADLGRVQRLTGDLPGADEALTEAVEVYRAIGHRDGEAAALTESGIVRRLTGDLRAASDAHAQALDVFRAIGHRHGEATALTNLGIMRLQTGDLPGAGDALTRALDVFRAIGHRHGEATALNELGIVRRLTGDLRGAGDAHAWALEVFRAIGHGHGEATALTNLGRARQAAGDLPGAGDAHARALEVFRAIGHRNGEAIVLTSLGRLRQLSGDLPGAVDTLARALEIFRATGDRNDEAWALNHYAAAIVATGDLLRALELYRQALAMNRELNKPDEEAVALEGLGMCHVSAGQAGSGAARLREALEIFRRLGMALDAERVQAGLARLG